MLGDLSRLLNQLTGGLAGQTLCARMALKWNSDCLPCRLIGRALRDMDNCAKELRDWLNK